MNYNYLIIILLVIIIFVLILLLAKSLKNTPQYENDEFHKLKEQIDSLIHKTIEQNGYFNSKIEEIGELTKKMTNAMTTNISDMGQMGEIILENILQECGMTKDRDYKLQYTDRDEDGKQFRPDVVIFLPENRNIIIDSKMPMKDWYEFQNLNDDENEKKNICIKNFTASIKNHINSISKKNYKYLLSINSPDYVFIFMPHEFAMITAQKYDPSIASLAQSKQIIIVGPSTLIMCMKLVESIWRLDKQSKNSNKIAELAGGMYDQIAKSLNLIEEINSNLNKSLVSVEKTKKYIKEGNSSLFGKVNKMRELGAKSKIDIK